MLFFIVLGAILGAYIFGIASFAMGRSLPARSHLLSAAVFSALLGIGSALIVGPGIGAVSGHFAAVAGLSALVAMAASAATALCLFASPAYGSLAASVLLLILGVAAGGLTPIPYMPAWLQPLGHVLPNGLALSALRGSVYFHGAHVSIGIIGLTVWLAASVAAMETIERARNRRTSRTA